MSKPFKGPTWDDVLAILEEWEQGHGSPPEGWPAWCGNGDTDRHGRRGQSPSGFAASLAAQLEQPPRLEPGPRPTLSNAVDPPAVKTEGRAAL
jgi:hypothetical protein